MYCMFHVYLSSFCLMFISDLCGFLTGVGSEKGDTKGW